MTKKKTPNLPTVNGVGATLNQLIERETGKATAGMEKELLRLEKEVEGKCRVIEHLQAERQDVLDRLGAEGVKDTDLDQGVLALLVDRANLKREFDSRASHFVAVCKKLEISLDGVTYAYAVSQIFEKIRAAETLAQRSKEQAEAVIARQESREARQAEFLALVPRVIATGIPASEAATVAWKMVGEVGR